MTLTQVDKKKNKNIYYNETKFRDFMLSTYAYCNKISQVKKTVTHLEDNREQLRHFPTLWIPRTGSYYRCYF